MSLREDKRAFLTEHFGPKRTARVEAELRAQPAPVDLVFDLLLGRHDYPRRKARTVAGLKTARPHPAAPYMEQLRELIRRENGNAHRA